MRPFWIPSAIAVIGVVIGCGRGVDPAREADDGTPAVAGKAAGGRSKRAPHLDLLAAPHHSSWTVSERPLDEIGGDAKVVNTSWTVSEDGNHYAFAITVPLPPEPEEDQDAVPEESSNLPFSGRPPRDPAPGSIWIVDGDRRIALRADDETLSREFADQVQEGLALDGRDFDKLVEGSFQAVQPGCIYFSRDGRFVNVAQARAKLLITERDGYRDVIEPGVFAFWTDGEFCGVLDGPVRRASDVLREHWGVGAGGADDCVPHKGQAFLTDDLGRIGFIAATKTYNNSNPPLVFVVDLTTKGRGDRCVFHALEAELQAGDGVIRWFGHRGDGSLVVCTISATSISTTPIAESKGYSSGDLLPNGGTLLVGESPNEGSVIVFNGVPQKRFEKLVGIRTSPDGRHYVAITAERGKAFALVDNEVTELPLATREILPGVQPELSLELRGLGIDDEANWRALISIGTDVVHLENGNVLGAYAWTGAMALEDGSARYAFAAIDEREDPRAKQVILTPMLVVDGRARAVEGLDPVTIDRQEDGMQTLMARGMAAASLAEHLGDAVALGPGGTSVLTWTSPQRDQDSVVRINGRVLGGDGHALHPDVAPQLSPSGRDALFVAKAQGEWKLLANGEALAGYDEIGVGGTRVGFTPQGTYTFLASRAGTYFWVEARPAE